MVLEPRDVEDDVLPLAPVALPREMDAVLAEGGNGFVRVGADILPGLGALGDVPWLVLRPLMDHAGPRLERDGLALVGVVARVVREEAHDEGVVHAHHRPHDLGVGPVAAPVKGRVRDRVLAQVAHERE